VVPGILECARADRTLYEIRNVMEKAFGSYKEPVFFSRARFYRAKPFR
jgi:hypothetical protein